jgi:capsular exopolysaccharide synthesis family protein
MSKTANQKKAQQSKLLEISERAPFQFVEAYKSLRTNIQFASANSQVHRLIITSSVPGEGKSTVVVNLGIALVESGRKVLLVDSDLRKPMLHRFLQIENNNVGLTNAVQGLANIEDCIVKITRLGIDVIPSGPIPSNPVELIDSEKMGQIIAELSQRYDYILYDTPPVSVVTDAAVLSKVADGVVFVVRQNYTTVETAQAAIKNLNNVGANIIGSVLNTFEIEGGGRYGVHKGYKKYMYGYR